MASSNSKEMASMATQICNQIASIFSNPTDPYPSPLDVLVSELTTVVSINGCVFLYGVGREGLMLKALCMRLAHLGLSAHLVFDMTTPHIATGDLLIASAGPGGFAHGGRVLLLTSQPNKGSCAKHAGVVAYVAAQTMADDMDARDVKSRSLLPMGVCMKGSCSFCSRWLFTSWGRPWVRAPKPFDHVTLILNENYISRSILRSLFGFWSCI